MKIALLSMVLLRRMKSECQKLRENPQIAVSTPNKKFSVFPGKTFFTAGDYSEVT